MANGDFVQLDTHRFSVKLLDGQTTTNNGAWVEVPARYNIRSITSTTLEEGASDATVDIHVSNAATKPSDATAGIVLQQLSTALYHVTFTNAFRWMKAVKTQGTTPVATTVILEAARQS